MYQLFGDFGNSMEAFLVGKTLLGMRAADIWRGVDWLVSRPEVDAARIYSFGVGAGGVMVLHEGVLDDRITKVALMNTLLSYQAALEHRLHHRLYESIVPAVLKLYDLADLAAALAPRSLWIVNAVDPLGRRVGLNEAATAYTRPAESFKKLGAERAFQISLRSTEEPLNVF